MSTTPPNLKRFKSSMQGMRDFAILVEQSDPKHRQMVIDAARADDPEFTEKALRKVVFFEELIYLDDTVLTEILSKITPKVLAFALCEMPEEFVGLIYKQMSYREKKRLLDEQEALGKISEPFILGARKQVLEIARHLEEKNKIVFELSLCPRFESEKKAV